MSHPTRHLGPDSILWRYAGDHRLGLSGLSVGILQLLHPAIGAGVVEHSSFFEEPWDRILRSIPQILGVVLRPGARSGRSPGAQLPPHHQGVDHLGPHYRALEPETFWWAHATFQHGVKQVVDRFDHHRLTTRPRRAVPRRRRSRWYRRYGVSMRPVPPDYASFRAEWQRQCRDVLEMTPAASRAIDMALTRPTARTRRSSPSGPGHCSRW